jgi:lysophospholipase L1-like esterase
MSNVHLLYDGCVKAIFIAAALSLSAAAQPPTAGTLGDLVLPTDPRIQIIGRTDASDPMRPRLAYPGTTVRFRLRGSAAGLSLETDSAASYLETIVDGGEPQIVAVSKGASEISLAGGLDAGLHTIEVVKRTETWQGILTLVGIRISKPGALLDPTPLPHRKLLFIGDSVTCGAGVDNYPQCQTANNRSSNAYDSYGMVLGRRLDAQVHLVCYGGRGVWRDYRGLRDILNAPQFFHYSVPSDDPKQRAAWSDTRWVPNTIVVSLGTNDFNLQKKDPLPPGEFVDTYVSFLRELILRYPTAIVFATQGSIVTDPLLSQYTREAVARVADDRVRWVESRHYPGSQCDAHPDKPQHARIADDLEPALRGALNW